MRALWRTLLVASVLWLIALALVSDGLSNCADGWISSSYGQGRCSWHGGAVVQSEIRIVNTVFAVFVFVWALIVIHVAGKDEKKRKAALEAAKAERAKTTPVCPHCQVQLVLRRAGRGPHKGEWFWGCRNYPRCKVIVHPSSAPVFYPKQPNDP